MGWNDVEEYRNVPWFGISPDSLFYLLLFPLLPLASMVLAAMFAISLLVELADMFFSSLDLAQA